MITKTDFYVKVYIYGLLDDNDNIIYIGKSSTPKSRLYYNVNNGYPNVKKLKIIDFFSDLEQYYIQKYIDEGFVLNNKHTSPNWEDWNLGDILEVNKLKKVSCINTLTNKKYETIEEASIDIGISRGKIKGILTNKNHLLRNKYPLEFTKETKI